MKPPNEVLSRHHQLRCFSSRSFTQLGYMLINHFVCLCQELQLKLEAFVTGTDSPQLNARLNDRDVEFSETLAYHLPTKVLLMSFP